MRHGERKLNDKQTPNHIHIHIHIYCYIYIYIFVKKKKKKENKQESCSCGQYGSQPKETLGVNYIVETRQPN